MKIRKKSEITGKYHSMSVNITPEQYEKIKKDPMFIQEISEDLTKAEITFLTMGALEDELPLLDQLGAAETNEQRQAIMDKINGELDGDLFLSEEDDN